MQRLARLIPGVWLGLLLAVALLATPAPFAVLAQADAGRVVARVLAQEAATSLALGVILLMLERRSAKQRADLGEGSQFSTAMALAAGAVFCTVAGYYALQPLMAAAKAGQGALSFGQLHALSSAFFVVKLLLVAALAWRTSASAQAALREPRSS